MRFVIWENSVVLLAMESSAHDRKHSKNQGNFIQIWQYPISSLNRTDMSVVFETFLPTFLDTLTLQKACCPWGNQRVYQALETELSVWRGRRIRAEREFVWKKRCPLGKVAKQGHIHPDKGICQWTQTQTHTHSLSLFLHHCIQYSSPFTMDRGVLWKATQVESQCEFPFIQSKC